MNAQENIPETSELGLVLAARQGDREAFGQLVER